MDVYQTHARIALESGDMDEYNQCQSRLKELHLAGVAGVRMDEFTGYRLVYSLYRQNHRLVCHSLRVYLNRVLFYLKHHVVFT